MTARTTIAYEKLKTQHLVGVSRRSATGPENACLNRQDLNNKDETTKRGKSNDHNDKARQSQ